MENILLGNLEKVGQAVLKNDYTITPKSNNVNYLYYLNDNIHKNKHKLWHNIARSKRQMLYGVSDHLYHQRFISENGSNNEMFRIFLK